ncbi:MULTISPECIES: ATP-grasp domain-containing protein [unclassified Streptomyces]|uniref:ATP-grasp domain-containing protein n=1 Tax=unclassified Streptomyces TaxID=2593676 RepID=UPI00093D6E5D|nr:ATP-grasp domain-containing protein [Streptomyces sp. CB01883]OKJ74421.1 hypothetical protein AMK32_36190 [Streptomyces sp. CB01883]
MNTVSQPATGNPSSGQSGGTLVLGWRSATTEVLESLGERVTCVVSPGDVKTARRRGFGGELIVVPDPTNVEHVLSGLARKGIAPESFGAVGTNLELAVVAASVVGELSAARALGVRTAILLRDKVAQKAAVRKAGVPVAECFTVDALTELPSTGSAYPLVVKPLAGAGTVNTFALSSAAEAAELQRLLPGEQGYGPWAVEEFIDGVEVQIDGVVRDGEVVFLAISRYLQNLITIKQGGLVGCVLLEPSNHRETYTMANDVVARALAALEHADGVFHLEGFLQEDRLIFSECAGRTSGGMVREMLQKKFGIDLVAEWGRSLLGISAQIPDDSLTDLCYGDVHLVAPPGEICSVPTVDQILEREGVVEATVETRPGNVAADPSTSSNVKAGRVIAAGASESEVEENLKAVAQWFLSSATTN